jgi:hypothetical protein
MLQAAQQWNNAWLFLSFLVRFGLGRVVALHRRSSISYPIR